MQNESDDLHKWAWIQHIWKVNFKYEFVLNGGLGWRSQLNRALNAGGGTGGKPTYLCDKSRT